MSNLTYLLVVALRACMLGLIVYYATSTIPSKEIATNNKLVISIIVVVLYAVMDYFGGFFIKIRELLCQATCGCSPSSIIDLEINKLTQDTSNTIDLSTPVPDLELEEAIKALRLNSEETLNLSDESEEALGALNTKPLNTLSAQLLGLEEEKDDNPVPAESAEGFSNYGPVF